MRGTPVRRMNLEDLRQVFQTSRSKEKNRGIRNYAD